MRNNGVFLRDEHHSSGVLGKERGILGGPQDGNIIKEDSTTSLTLVLNLIEAHVKKL